MENFIRKKFTNVPQPSQFSHFMSLVLLYFRLLVNFLTFANPYFVDRTGPAVQKLIHVCDFEEVETILEISEVKSSFEGDCTFTS